ncbi:MAG: CRISPR-associated endonuclease Cas2 [Candidatus Hadarchaeales archaeon]
METLVIYDISSNRLRNALSNRLFDYGLQRVQLSAFSGELNSHDREVLLKELPNFLGSQRDRIYVIPLCDRCVRLWRSVSKEPLEPTKKQEVKII